MVKLRNVYYNIFISEKVSRNIGHVKFGIKKM
jgi:hypothetical protein